MQRLGVGYEAVAAVNPRIVYCSLSGFGQTGPLRDRPGHDLNYCASAGVADQIGTREGPRCPTCRWPTCWGRRMTAVMGILAALFDAARTGRGRHVDIAMADGVLAHAVMPLAALASTAARGAPAGGTLTGELACYGSIARRMVATSRSARWSASSGMRCAGAWSATTRPLASHRRCGDRRQACAGARRDLRVAHPGALERACSPMAKPASRRCFGWTRRGSPALPARGMVAARIRHSSTTAVRPARQDERLRAQPAAHAPRPGEHTDEVLREAGFEQDELRRLAGGPAPSAKLVR